MTATELLVADALLTANPDALPLVEQWVTEQFKQERSIAELRIQRDGWQRISQKRELTDLEQIKQDVCFALISQAEE